MKTGYGALIAAAFAIAACSGPAAEAKAPAATSTPGATSAPPTSAAAAASATAEVKAHKVGDAVDAGGVTAHLLQFRPSVTLDAPPDGPGNHWAAAKIKTCWTGDIEGAKDGDSIAVTWGPWSLVDAEDGRWKAFEGPTLNQWLKPVYPQFQEDGTMKRGECIVGWIEFSVGDGVKVAGVRYSPVGRGAITWAV